jgi:hypothetical protein
MKKTYTLLPISILIFCFSSDLDSQFYKVYEYQTLDANEKELVYWTTFIPSSDLQYPFFGDTVSRQGLFAHSFEIEYGISNRFTVALYADFEQPKGKDFRWVRAKAVMLYYSLFEKNKMPLDMALYLEYKLPKKDYQTSEEIELKLILEKDIKFHRIILNPTFEKKISGEDVTEGLEFVLNGAYTYTGSLVFQPRLEYYSKIGEYFNIPNYAVQKNYIFPAFDLYLGKYGQFRWHAGIGFGLTDPADNMVIKSILSWEFF